VLSQDERQRPTNILAVKPAIEAVYKDVAAQGEARYRPFWWLHVVVLGGTVLLRGEAACEPYATDAARQAIRDCLLGFPDDLAAAASWRLQRVAIPTVARVIGGEAPLETWSENTRGRLAPEDQFRWDFRPSWFFMHGVARAMREILSNISPWDAPTIDKETGEFALALDRLPIPTTEWHGPMGDDWLRSWQRVDPLLMCSLATLVEFPQGDDLLDDRGVQRVILNAAASEHELLRRPAVPLAKRLGLV
jgi:hypothetical protein